MCGKLDKAACDQQGDGVCISDGDKCGPKPCPQLPKDKCLSGDNCAIDGDRCIDAVDTPDTKTPTKKDICPGGDCQGSKEQNPKDDKKKDDKKDDNKDDKDNKGGQGSKGT